VRSTLSDPVAREQLSQILYQQYGMTLEELLEQLHLQ
jgi:hypothetical protein